MNLTFLDQQPPILEGIPNQPLIERVDDVIRVLEECYGYSARRLLLYPENLSPNFFDLSSREAGEIVQKFRNYRIRIAIMRTPALRTSRLFGELMTDELEGEELRMFDEREHAIAWLSKGHA